MRSIRRGKSALCGVATHICDPAWMGSPGSTTRRCAAADEVRLVAGDAAIGEWSRAIDGDRRSAGRRGRQRRVAVGRIDGSAGGHRRPRHGDAPMTLVSTLARADRRRRPGADRGRPHRRRPVQHHCRRVRRRRAIPTLQWLASSLDRQCQRRLAAGASRATVRRRPSAPTKRSASDDGDGTARSRRCSTCEGYDTRTPVDARSRLVATVADRAVGQLRTAATSMVRAAPQLAGETDPLRLPGGLVVDATIRQVVADDSSSAPAPWSAAAEFRAWLSPRYWSALHERASRPVDRLPRSGESLGGRASADGAAVRSPSTRCRCC